MVHTGSKQSIVILKSEYFQNMTLKMTWVVIQNSQLWSHLYQTFGISFFWQGRVNGKFWDRPVHCVYIFTKLVIKCSFLNQSLPTGILWNFLRSKPSYNNVLGTSSLLLLVPPAAKAGGSHQNIMLIMWEPLIMREPESGRIWTSKVFNAVITLDTYQFLNIIKSQTSHTVLCIETVKKETEKGHRRIDCDMHHFSKLRHWAYSLFGFGQNL